MSLRRLGFGLATVLGLARRGFFIPYRYAAAVPPPGARPPYAAIATLFEACEAGFAALLARLGDHAGAFEAIAAAPAPAPRWTQDWFPRLDAAVAYAMVRGGVHAGVHRGAPARIVEVGSGHSTRFLARAVADGGLATTITAIDPAPRVAIRDLSDRGSVQWIEATLQEAGEATFEGLAPGDVVFIDSSHIAMPGSDVDMLLNRVLPALAAGVRVHLHDVFLPDDYPAEWAWRGYNEQLCVAAMLQGGAWRPLFASHYAATRMAEAVAASAVGRLPLAPGAHESSLWLEKQ